MVLHNWFNKQLIRRKPIMQRSLHRLHRQVDRVQLMLRQKTRLNNDRFDRMILFFLQTTANKDVTDRMTDSSHYTGTHKERFDAEGHGKGKEGRVDDAKNSGYVGNYKGEGTYDKKR